MLLGQRDVTRLNTKKDFHRVVLPVKHKHVSVVWRKKVWQPRQQCGDEGVGLCEQQTVVWKWSDQTRTCHSENLDNFRNRKQRRLPLSAMPSEARHRKNRSVFAEEFSEMVLLETSGIKKGRWSKSGRVADKNVVESACSSCVPTLTCFLLFLQKNRLPTTTSFACISSSMQRLMSFRGFSRRGIFALDRNLFLGLFDISKSMKSFKNLKRLLGQESSVHLVHEVSHLFAETRIQSLCGFESWRDVSLFLSRSRSHTKSLFKKKIVNAIVCGKPQFQTETENETSAKEETVSAILPVWPQLNQSEFLKCKECLVSTAKGIGASVNAKGEFSWTEGSQTVTMDWRDFQTKLELEVELLLDLSQKETSEVFTRLLWMVKKRPQDFLPETELLDCDCWCFKNKFDPKRFDVFPDGRTVECCHVTEDKHLAVLDVDICPSLTHPSLQSCRIFWDLMSKQIQPGHHNVFLKLLKTSILRNRPQNIILCFCGPPMTGKTLFASLLTDLFNSWIVRANDDQVNWPWTSDSGTAENIELFLLKHVCPHNFSSAVEWMWNGDDICRSLPRIVATSNELLSPHSDLLTLEQVAVSEADFWGWPESSVPRCFEGQDGSCWPNSGCSSRVVFIPFNNSFLDIARDIDCFLGEKKFYSALFLLHLLKCVP